MRAKAQETPSVSRRWEAHWWPTLIKLAILCLFVDELWRLVPAEALT